MPDILPLLLSLQPALPKTTARQLHRIIVAMLSMTGRITQLGISRWTDQGGSYRTIQRFFHTEIDWLEVQWRFFQLFVYDPKAVYLLAGDESVVTKAGKHTFGIGRFFSSLFDKAIPGVALFSIAVVNVGKRQAYSLANEQVIRTDEEIEQAKKRKQQRKKGSKDKKSARKPGRPAGSKNKNKAEVVLSPELLRIQAQLNKALKLIKTRMSVSFFVLDGHFGNHLACQMVRQSGLHLISKMRCDAALYLEPTPFQSQQQPRRKYGDRLDYANLPLSKRRSSHTEDGYETQVYQMRCLHKDFAHALNVVVIQKTRLADGHRGHVILFSTEWFLSAETLIDYYALRFQIEFTFRAAKQHFGLEDFMGVKKTSVSNAMSLSFFMVNLSSYLLDSFRTRFAGAGISDLRSWYRGHHYASALLKLLPQSPDPIICDQLLEQICCLGLIHPPSQRATERTADLEMAA
jgi:putative transposase